jgi:hypothetical protein
MDRPQCSHHQQNPWKAQLYGIEPTPTRYDELVAGGEDLYDGLIKHAAAIGVQQNTPAKVRADLDALIAAKAAQDASEGAQPAKYTAQRLADSNAKGFIAAAIKVISITYGNAWSDAWQATGLPDNTVGVPTTLDGRYTALNGLKAFFTKNPTMEVSTPTVVVTAALATTLWTAFKAARDGVKSGLTDSKDKLMAKDDALAAFKERYRATIAELDQLLEDDDPKWYDFGLIRPADPQAPGAPFHVHATAIGGGKVLVQLDGSRRANSFNYYKQVVGTDADPVKVANSEGTQWTIEGLTVGATVKVTVTGVNDGGEGPASTAVSVVMT